MAGVPAPASFYSWVVPGALCWWGFTVHCPLSVHTWSTSLCCVRIFTHGNELSEELPGSRPTSSLTWRVVFLSQCREVIQNSKEVLCLLQEKNPAFQPVLAVIQVSRDRGSVLLFQGALRSEADCPSVHKAGCLSCLGRPIQA